MKVDHKQTKFFQKSKNIGCVPPVFTMASNVTSEPNLDSSNFFYFSVDFPDFLDMVTTRKIATQLCVEHKMLLMIFKISPKIGARNKCD